jgi:hypothetical protein
MGGKLIVEPGIPPDQCNFAALAGVVIAAGDLQRIKLYKFPGFFYLQFSIILNTQDVTVHRAHIRRLCNLEIYAISSAPGSFKPASDTELALRTGRFGRKWGTGERVVLHQSASNTPL